MPVGKKKIRRKSRKKSLLDEYDFDSPSISKKELERRRRILIEEFGFEKPKKASKKKASRKRRRRNPSGGLPMLVVGGLAALALYLVVRKPQAQIKSA